MTTMTAMHTRTGTATRSSAVTEDLLRAVAARDEARLRALFSPDVWVRAMLVREVVERHDVDGALELFRGWFGAAAELEVLERSSHPVATREQIRYRFLLRPAWAPAVWHLIEQTGYVRVRDGRISRLDLVCTGFVPLDDGAELGASAVTA